MDGLEKKSVELMSDIIVYNKYARYRSDLKRRETFEEIIDRYVAAMLKKYCGEDVADSFKKSKSINVEKGSLAEQIVLNSKHLYDKKVLPSMRGLQFAGPALEKNESRIYNCYYHPIKDIASFSETMFLLLGGTGVGFSVRKHHVAQLPPITKPLKDKKFLVSDDIEGWADAIKVLLKSYLGVTKYKPRFDFSAIRERGEILVTSGGKAPGAGPLRVCLAKIESLLEAKEENSQLKPIEVHDIICFVADAVLAGGIRRAALISLFSPDDEEMMAAKAGNWWETNPQRGRANNSFVVNVNDIDKQEFDRLMQYVEDSGSGEPGVYFTQDDGEGGTNPCKPLDATILTPNGYITFKEALEMDELEVITPNGTVAKATKPFKTGEDRDVFEVFLSNGESILGTSNHRHQRSNGEWARIDELDIGDELQGASEKGLENWGVYFVRIMLRGTEDVYDITVHDTQSAFIDNGVVTHNCCEIYLRPYSFCNLCDINAGTIENQDDFNERAKVASFFGTLQAGFTDFHYLKSRTRRQTEEDYLVGVGLTGICNGNVLGLNLQEAARKAMLQNSITAAKIGIGEAARVTTVKPAGSTSSVLGVSSGIHAWHSKYYVRNFQCKVGDDMYNFFTEHHPELIKVMDQQPDSAVIGCPIKAPNGAITRENDDITQFLERVKRFNEEWVREGHRWGDNTNNVSATVSVRDDEWGFLKDWMWENKESFHGLSVLPYFGGTYKDAPFQECDEKEFLRRLKLMEEVDLTKIKEDVDNTDLTGELACAGGACDLEY
jgi:hypothetical protein